MSPEYVRPYVKAQKNDDRDAEGIAEAASRPTMRFVDLKSQEQLDIQTLHRVRSRLVAERTTLINQMRAILLERGLVFAAGRCKFERAVDTLLEERASGLSERVHRLVAELRDEWKVLDTKIAALNAEFLSLARDNLAVRRLTCTTQRPRPSASSRSSYSPFGARFGMCGHRSPRESMAAKRHGTEILGFEWP